MTNEIYFHQHDAQIQLVPAVIRKVPAEKPSPICMSNGSKNGSPRKPMRAIKLPMMEIRNVRTLNIPD